MLDGGSTSQKNVGTYVILPYIKQQGISCLEAVVLTHTDQDHISGIEELLELCAQKLTTVRVKNLILPDWDTTGGEYEKLKMLADIDRGNQRENRMSVIEEIAATGSVIMSLKTSFPAEYVTDDNNFRSLLYYYGLLTMESSYGSMMKW